MPTLNIQAEPPSARPDFVTPDFVSTDSADLACHMDHCAGSHSRFLPLQSALQSVHSVLSPRIVTVAVITAIAAISLALLAA